MQKKGIFFIVLALVVSSIIAGCAPAIRKNVVFETPGEGRLVITPRFHVCGFEASEKVLPRKDYVPVVVIAAPSEEEKDTDNRRASSLRTAKKISIEDLIEKIAGVVVTAVSETQHIRLEMDKARMKTRSHMLAPTIEAYYFTEGSDNCYFFGRLPMEAVKFVAESYGDEVHKQMIKLIREKMPDWENEVKSKRKEIKTLGIFAPGR